VNLKNLSGNWKFFIGFVFVLLVAAPVETLNPTDQSTSIFQLLMGLIFYGFIVRLIAQRGQRVGFSYGGTLVCAIFALPLTAFVVYVVRQPKK
jgi:hypothetical protein